MELYFGQILEMRKIMNDFSILKNSNQILYIFQNKNLLSSFKPKIFLSNPPRMSPLTNPQIKFLIKILRSPSDHGRNGPPLAGENLGQMQKHLLFLSAPLGLLDTRVDPLVPPGLALFGRLAHQQRGDTRPLVQTVFHHRRFQDLVLNVLPNSSFQGVAHWI